MKIESLVVLVVAIVLMILFASGYDRVRKAKQTTVDKSLTDAQKVACGWTDKQYKESEGVLISGIVISVLLLVVSGMLFLHHGGIMSIPGVKKSS